MRTFKLFLLSLSLLLSTGCVSQDCPEKEATVLPGTDTAVVKIYLDKRDYPQATAEIVTVKPGQKILFAGPDQFEIIFKNQQSPIGKLEVRSENGVVVIEIPKDIFERNRKKAGTSAARELLYKYGIQVNGKLTDPTIRIIPS